MSQRCLDITRASATRLAILQIEFSSNISLEYPDLYEKLRNWSSTNVLWIWLGPNQTFFVKLQEDFYYKVPSAIKPIIDTIEGDITAVALGINKTYVIIHGNELTYDLKDYYGELGIILKDIKLIPRVCLPKLSEPGLF